MAGTLNILSIDGGGIRGIIPAIVLAYIEKHTGKRIADIFDLIAGTSTGGILALGLAKPGEDGGPQYSAADLVALYEQEGGKIFSRSIWHRLRSLGSIVEEKYPAAGLEDVLKRYFGDVLFKDALTELLITSYDIERRKPHFFKRWRERESAGQALRMTDVARATSAAPTYFEPHRLQTAEQLEEYFALIDGGVFANNPAMCAVAEARKRNPDKESLLLISLGTGELTRKILYDDAKKWGLAGWARPLLNVIFDGVSDSVDYQCWQLLPPEADETRHYYRFQISLTEGSDDMDDAGKGNIRLLKLHAEDIINNNRNELNELCSRLRTE